MHIFWLPFPLADLLCWDGTTDCKTNQSIWWQDAFNVCPRSSLYHATLFNLPHFGQYDVRYSGFHFIFTFSLLHIQFTFTPSVACLSICNPILDHIGINLKNSTNLYIMLLVLLLMMPKPSSTMPHRCHSTRSYPPMQPSRLPTQPIFALFPTASMDTTFNSLIFLITA